jgi:hypothetical protein
MNTQRDIVIHKNNKQNAPFLTLSMATIIDTYKKLNNAEAFYLYLNLCGNTNNFTVSFSAEKMSEKYGQSASILEESFDKLVEAGILVKQKNNSTYDFYSDNTPINTYSNFKQKNAFDLRV